MHKFSHIKDKLWVYISQNKFSFFRTLNPNICGARLVIFDKHVFNRYDALVDRALPGTVIVFLYPTVNPHRIFLSMQLYGDNISIYSPRSGLSAYTWTSLFMRLSGRLLLNSELNSQVLSARLKLRLWHAGLVLQAP